MQVGLQGIQVAGINYERRGNNSSNKKIGISRKPTNISNRKSDKKFQNRIPY